jgi:hypothetical protein
VAEARQRWRHAQALLDSTRLVFIDETGTNTAMTRLRGRCRRGLRLIGRVPHGHRKTTTFVAGLRCVNHCRRTDGRIAPAPCRLRVIHCDHDIADFAAGIRARMGFDDADERIAAVDHRL